MAHITRLGAVVATVMIMGCGSPSSDPPVEGQATGSSEALVSASTHDLPGTSPGVKAIVRQDSVPSSSVRTTAPPQISSPMTLLSTTTDGSCVAPDTDRHMAASRSAASPSNKRADAACVRRKAQQGWDVQGQAHPGLMASLQAQELWMEQHSDVIAPMIYTQADRENELDYAHELWEEQVIQEVTEFDTP